MNKKRMMAAVLAAASVLTLTACGNSKGSSSADGEDPIEIA